MEKILHAIPTLRGLEIAKLNTYFASCPRLLTEDIKDFKRDIILARKFANEAKNNEKMSI